MSAKKKVEVEQVDLQPVELDPPDPALVRWQELADRDWMICHDGDASKVLEFPRPEWAVEDSDHIGKSPFGTAYRSERAVVTARGCADARNKDGLMSPAHVNVLAELWESGTRKVYLGIARFENEKWSETMLGLYPSEALELAEVLRAAVDLLGGTGD
ncbi:hypothetical protein [[Mycobacterium] burgundiense]|uniref:Phage ABA sandwich domain-containing protein n=1 Tax=[Mycobacterium] burgundiense TaxID=3064286 RepID=A0ABM9L9C0_9MYCO|nr:hypothetical protein [Mycolicibacterium sp. MU0053]CAJ1495120.1 hypothetical protein MU0053_000276 [Mycolicibacterium sp. MU0053]